MEVLHNGSLESEGYLTERTTHFEELVGVVDKLRQQNSLCDVTLLVEGQRIRAHRIILAGCSPYFSAMFVGRLHESQQELIEIKDVDAVSQTSC